MSESLVVFVGNGSVLYHSCVIGSVEFVLCSCHSVAWVVFGREVVILRFGTSFLLLFEGVCSGIFFGVCLTFLNCRQRRFHLDKYFER